MTPAEHGPFIKMCLLQPSQVRLKGYTAIDVLNEGKCNNLPSEIWDFIRGGRKITPPPAKYLLQSMSCVYYVYIQPR